ncbi:MAG: MoaD/ThiS family protein [Pseudomonadota bacterium]
MVTVQLFSSLSALADGQREIKVEAKTVGDVLVALARAYPGLADKLDGGVSVAVDGRVIASGLTEPVSETSEVVILERLKGG